MKTIIHNNYFIFCLVGIIIGSFSSIEIELFYKFILLFLIIGILFTLKLIVLIEKKPIIWIYIYTCSVIIIPDFNIGSVPVHPMEYLLVIGIVVIWMKNYNEGKLPFNKLLIPIITYILCMLLSLLFIYFNNREFFLISFFKVVRFGETLFPVVYMLILVKKISKDDILAFFKVFIISSFLTVVLGITFFLIQLEPEVPQKVWIGSNIYYRASGIFQEANHFGAFLAFSTAINLYLILIIKRFSFFYKILVFVNLPLTIITLVLTFSKGSWLSLVVALLLIYGFNRRIKIKTKISWLIILSVIVVLMKNLFPNIFEYVVSEKIFNTLSLATQDLNTASSGRISNWQKILSYYLDSPVVGIGYKNTINFIGVPPDNNYISVMVETGVIGLLAFLALNFTFYYIAFKTYRYSNKLDGEINQLSMFVIFVLVSLNLQMFTVDLFTYWRLLSCFVIILIIGYLYIINLERSENLIDKSSSSYS